MWSLFWPKINTFELFFRSVPWIFLRLCLMSGIKKWFKVTVLIFVENSCYAQNGINGILGSKINISEVFFKSVHWIL